MRKVNYLVMSLLLSVFFVAPVFAVDIDPNQGVSLSEEQKGAISVGCQSIKNTLKNLQKSDSNTRVHLGTSYQNILSNYMTPLNLRLVKNNQLSANLNDILNDYNKTRDNFNQQFVTYSKQLEELISIDCQSEPENFYAMLIKVRAERSKLAKQAASMKAILERHQAAVKELKNV